MQPPVASGPCVYILRCADGTLYTGAAVDLERRLKTHLAGRGARYTRGRLPVALAWFEACPDWPSALRREHQLKRLTRPQKEALVKRRATGADEERRRSRGTRGEEQGREAKRRGL